MFSLSDFPFTWRDMVDIAFVTALFYYVIRFIRGTRAVAAINGLMLLLLLYVVAQLVGLYTLIWLLDNIFGSLFLVIVILFQQDIRHVLSSLSLQSLFKVKKNQQSALIQSLVNTCMSLAAKKVGAIIVLERTVPLGDVVERGVRIDAEVSQDLLATIFSPNTALHDGAVIISRRGRLLAAGCILPLAQIDRQHFGTRHRAALGITEGTDALALVVSEERGEVTIAQDSKLSNPLTPDRLEKILTNALS